MKYSTPKDATIAITYSCNSRCQMCNIWQIKNPLYLEKEVFYNLSKSIKYINLSGGEPFLRNDLPEIVKIIKQTSPKAQIIISSNGFLTKKIIDTMKEILKINKDVGVRISIDGIDKEHDRVRGVKGAYEKALNTIKGLKEIGVDNLGLSFTLMDNNADELLKVYELSKEVDIQFTMAAVQNSDIYFDKKDNLLRAQEKVSFYLDYIIKNELKSLNPKKWFRAYYTYGLKYYLENKKRVLPSGAGFDSLFIDPNGDVYPSNLINLRLGNIKVNKLDHVWKSKKAIEARQRIINEDIQESWIICTIRGQFKKNIFKIASWVLKNKLIK